MLASDIKEEAESYESQSQEEAGKAKKRSMWATVGGLVGGGLALMAAPAVIGAAAGAGLLGATAAATGAGSLATGIGTGLIVGGGSGLGGKWGKEGSEKGFSGLGEKTKRKDIKVDKFYTKAAEEATETFKDYDKAIDESIQKQAVVSGLLAGVQAGGGFKWAKGKVKGALSPTSQASTFDPSLVTAKEIGGTSGELAHITSKGSASAAQLTKGSEVGVKFTGYAGTDATGASFSDMTFAHGPASDRSLYSALKQNLFSTALTGGYSAMKNMGPQYSQIEEPDYTSIT